MLLHLNKLLFVTLLLAFSGMVSAQSGSLKGQITDTSGVPMSMVSVILLEPEDSTFEYFITTNKQGEFEINYIDDGKYLMQTSFIGYQTLNKLLIFDKTHRQMDLGTLVLEEQRNVLSEVVVEGQRIPIIINKDTVSYQADAFNVRADENVQDLLRRLPGVEVDAEGRVMAQGEEVTKVLVDGKEFFGGNVQIATQNLPADAVKNVKFYDRQSENAMYTGVDDGQREKTMDLELKEDRKKGVFGNLEAGYGTDEHYKLKGGIHAFNATSRLSVLANANDLNEYGFSFSDYMDMMNTGSGTSGRPGYTTIMVNSDSPIPLSWGAPNNGVFDSQSAGLNFNHDPSKKHRLNLTYFYTALDHNLLQTTEGQEFNPTQIVTSEVNEASNQVQGSHSGMLTYRWDLDTLNRLEFSGNASFRTQDNSGVYSSMSSLQDGSVIQTGDRTDDLTANNLRYTADLQYTHRFLKDKRNFTIRGYTSRDENDLEELYASLNTFPLDGRIETLDQFRMGLGTTRRLLFEGSYTEPLGEKHLVEVNLQYTDDNIDTRTDVFSAETMNFRPTLSPWYLLQRKQYRGGLEYQYNYQKEASLEIGVPVSVIDQDASNNRNDYTINPGYWVYWQPYVRWRREFTGFGRIYTSASREYNLPELNQWIVNPDSTNPLSVTLGNPDLIPEVNNSVRVSLHRHNSFNQHSFRFNISGTITENPIITARWVNPDFTRITQPKNISEPRYTFSAYGGYRFPVTVLKIFLSPRLSYTYSHVNEPLNGLTNQRQNQVLGPGLGISNFRDKKLSVSLNANYSLTWADYSLQPELNSYFVNQSYSLDLKYSPTERLTIRSDFNYSLYSNAMFAGSVAIPLWTASVAYTLLPEKSLTLKLTVFDILDQNLGLQREASGNNIYQVQANSLTRYAMVSVIYRFRRQ